MTHPGRGRSRGELSFFNAKLSRFLRIDAWRIRSRTSIRAHRICACHKRQHGKTGAASRRCSNTRTRSAPRPVFSFPWRTIEQGIARRKRIVLFQRIVRKSAWLSFQRIYRRIEARERRNKFYQCVANKPFGYERGNVRSLTRRNGYGRLRLRVATQDRIWMRRKKKSGGSKEPSASS